MGLFSNKKTQRKYMTMARSTMRTMKMIINSNNL